MDLKNARDFFRWGLRPIVGYVKDKESKSFKAIKRMKGFVPLQESDEELIDLVPEDLKEKAKEAYNLLVKEERNDNPEALRFWENNWWSSFGIESFAKRLDALEKEEGFVFVIWVSAVGNQFKVYDSIEEIAPEFFSEAA